MPRSYGGYVDPQEMQQMAGGNPYYNPLMETPDWGAGIRSTLNSMWMYKEKKRQEDEERRKEAAKEAEGQRRWEAQQAQEERRLKVMEDKAEDAVPITPAPVDRVGLKTIMRGMGVPPEQVDTIDALSDADLVKVKDKIIGRYGKNPAAPKPVKDTRGDELSAQIKADRKLLDDSIKALGKAKTKVYSDKNISPEDKQAAMNGLNAALGRIGEYRKLITKDQPLPQGIRDTINAISGDPTGLMTGDLTALGGGSPAPQGAPQMTPDVQQVAREIINRAARNGRQLSQREAEALAAQYLQSKQNAIR